MILEWDYEPPEGPGWYWHLDRQDEASVVQVIQRPGHTYLVVQFDSDGKRDFRSVRQLGGHWCGPLKQPIIKRISPPKPKLLAVDGPLAERMLEDFGTRSAEYAIYPETEDLCPSDTLPETAVMLQRVVYYREFLMKPGGKGYWRKYEVLTIHKGNLNVDLADHMVRKYRLNPVWSGYLNY